MTKLNYIKDGELGSTIILNKVVKELGQSLGLGSSIVTSLNYIRDGELATATNLNRAIRELLEALGIDPDSDKETFLSQLPEAPLPESDVVLGYDSTLIQSGEYEGVLDLTTTFLNGLEAQVAAIQYYEGDIALSAELIVPPYDFKYNCCFLLSREYADLHARAYNAAGVQIGRSNPLNFICNYEGGRVWIEGVENDDILFGTVPINLTGKRADPTASIGDAASWAAFPIRFTFRVAGRMIIDNFVASYVTPILTDRRHRLVVNVDTTRFPNGRHWLSLVGETREPMATPLIGFSPFWRDRWVVFDNGNSPMELRATYKQVWLIPTETVNIDLHIQNCDNSETVDVIVDAVSSDPAIATVDPITGIITAVAKGYAAITFTGSAGRIVVVDVMVKSSHQFKHLSGGGIRSTYDPLLSVFMVTFFWLETSEMSQPQYEAGELLKHIRYGGVNTMNSPWYFSYAGGGVPDSGPGSPTIEEWRLQQAPYGTMLANLAAMDLYSQSFGDDAWRGHNSMSWLFRWAPGLQSIIEAIEQTRDSGRVLVIDAVDEIDAGYGVTPLPAPADPWDYLLKDPPYNIPEYDVENDAWEVMRATIESVPNHTPLSMPVTGVADKDIFEAWNQISDVEMYFSLNSDLSTDTLNLNADTDSHAYAHQMSTHQTVGAKRYAIASRRAGSDPDKPKTMLAGVMGNFFLKRVYSGDGVIPGDDFFDYVPGIDFMGNPGPGYRASALQLLFGICAGFCGFKVYAFGDRVTGNRHEQVNPSTEYKWVDDIPVDAYQTGAGPTYSAGSGRWYAVTNVFSLMQYFLHELVLSPLKHAPDFGKFVFSGVRDNGTDKRMLILGNDSDSKMPVTVNLAPYQFAGGQTIKYRILDSRRIIEQVSEPTEEILLEEGEGIIYEFRSVAAGLRPAIKFNQPLFTQLKIKNPALITLGIEDLGGAAIDEVEFFFDADSVGVVSLAPFQINVDAAAFLLATQRINVWVPFGAVARSATGVEVEARGVIMFE